ncbi:hypothetical protein M3Y98_00920100 [Aphelenchoides besseyi]|nr:hypothetical protein M3Y98_00920100 [Aphelenchoides besseyi]
MRNHGLVVQNSSRPEASNSTHQRHPFQSSSFGIQSNGSRFGTSSSLRRNEMDAADDVPSIDDLSLNGPRFTINPFENATLGFGNLTAGSRNANSGCNAYGKSNRRRSVDGAPIPRKRISIRVPNQLDILEEIRKEQIRSFNCKNFNNSRFYDTKVLAVDGEVFYVSKSLLCAQSEFFLTRFSGRWDGNGEKNTIETGIESKALKPVMYYVQTGDPGDISDVNVEVFEAADYFGLDNLMRLVEKHMTDNFSKSTALCYLKFAKKYSAKLLDFKRHILQYAVKHISDIAELPEWKEFCENHHDIVNELMIFGR